MLNKKTLAYILPIFFCLLIIFIGPIAHAKFIEDSLISGDMRSHNDAFLDTSEYNSGMELGNLARIVIEAFLGLLAIIFIILIILGGYGWMMAGGDESKVTAAKERIKQAIIGLIITVSAYAITFNAIPWG